MSGEKEEAKQLRTQILALVAEYHRVSTAGQHYVAGESPIPVSGRVYDEKEMQSLVDASLDFWLTSGRYAEMFEKRFAELTGATRALLVNSGSSANLAAFSALTSSTLGARRIAPGDEVITLAAGFPTTINPILQNGAVPVFIDVELGTYNMDVSLLDAALSPRTKAIVAAHTLGNPFRVAEVAEFARTHGLWLIEDCCDALGASYQGHRVGTFGDLATYSFYPAHHITMGEGGCVTTRDKRLAKLVESFRDWGRDCWCAPGRDNTCGCRFGWKLGSLPEGYDHKYTYSHIGYNLKLTDMQAAVGVAQLEKLDCFIAARRANFKRLRAALEDVQEVLLLPKATPGSEPSWFGFPIAVRPESGYRRDDLVRHLNAGRIGTRLLFGGNLTRQPAYLGSPMRIIGNLDNSDYVMNNVFWVGVYPGLTPEMIDDLAAEIRRSVMH